MKSANIREGMIVHNGRGCRRRVVEITRKRHRGWNQVVVSYVPINRSGQEGTEASCTLNTFTSWAVGEWQETKEVSPYRQRAAHDLMYVLQTATDLAPATTDSQMVSVVEGVVDALIEAAKEELKRELGIGR